MRLTWAAIVAFAERHIRTSGQQLPETWGGPVKTFRPPATSAAYDHIGYVYRRFRLRGGRGQWSLVTTYEESQHSTPYRATGMLKQQDNTPGWAIGITLEYDSERLEFAVSYPSHDTRLIVGPARLVAGRSGVWTTGDELESILAELSEALPSELVMLIQSYDPATRLTFDRLKVFSNIHLGRRRVSIWDEPVASTEEGETYGQRRLIEESQTEWMLITIDTDEAVVPGVLGANLLEPDVEGGWVVNMSKLTLAQWVTLTVIFAHPVHGEYDIAWTVGEGYPESDDTPPDERNLKLAVLSQVLPYDLRVFIASLPGV